MAGLHDFFASQPRAALEDEYVGAGMALRKIPLVDEATRLFELALLEFIGPKAEDDSLWGWED